MFDKTFTLTSSDGSVSLTIKAGTEGVKSIQLASPPSAPKYVTSQQLIDIVAASVKEWLNAPTVSAPPTPSAGNP